MNTNTLAILLGVMLPAFASVAGADPSEHRIWLETSTEDGSLLAEPRVEAGHDALLRYEFSSTKVGPAGRSESRQAGSVRLATGETRALTRLRLSVVGDDKYILSLRVYEDERLVAEKSFTYPQ